MQFQMLTFIFILELILQPIIKAKILIYILHMLLKYISCFTHAFNCCKVGIGDIHSSWMTVLSGVSQGSVLVTGISARTFHQ